MPNGKDSRRRRDADDAVGVTLFGAPAACELLRVLVWLNKARRLARCTKMKIKVKQSTTSMQGTTKPLMNATIVRVRYSDLNTHRNSFGS